jgi:uncharacterized repeat protein (TIGR03803 family)
MAVGENLVRRTFVLLILILGPGVPVLAQYTFVTLANLDSDNANFIGGLAADASGNLYGTTLYGGANRCGTVFELAKGSHRVSTLISFNATGSNRTSVLIADASGNLCGTTGDGIVELAKGSGTVTTLATFDGSTGTGPSCLLIDRFGNLYGMTAGDGANNAGTVFELVKGSGRITVLASFDGSSAPHDRSGLVIDASGNLYGTTLWGGANDSTHTQGDGTVFEVVRGSGRITTLVSFDFYISGARPCDVIVDGSGNLYGTTTLGGAVDKSKGTVFEVVKGSGTITTLASFRDPAGNGGGALFEDASGNLYGTNMVGGADGVGSVFELAKGSSSITTLATFDGSNGSSPGALIPDGSGNLYGKTQFGGPYNDGTLFELSPTIAHSGQVGGKP